MHELFYPAPGKLVLIAFHPFLSPEVGFEGDNRTYVISQLDILIPEEEIEMEK